MVISSYFFYKKLQALSLLLSALLFSFLLFSSFKKQHSDDEVAEELKQIYIADCKKLNKSAAFFSSILEAYIDDHVTLDQLKKQFIDLKKSYKKIEYFIEYLDPDLAKELNGPPIEKVVIEQKYYLSLKHREPVFVNLPPEGLQVIEEILFDEKITKEHANEALTQAYLIEDRLLLFTNNLYDKKFTDKQFIESFREHLIRVMTLGIAAFDAPVAEFSLTYTQISLQPIFEALKLYQKVSNENFKDQNLKSLELVEKILLYLQQNTDFDTFDRMFFIRELADPAYGALTGLQKTMATNSKSKSFYAKPVNDEALSIFDVDFLNPGFYAKQDQKKTNPELENLGKILFFDPILSSNNQRSCASCHNPSIAFTDGKEKSIAFDFKGNIRRNAPTLINAIFSTVYFWDGRTEYLQDQIPDVLTNTTELHGTYEEVVQKLLQSTEYKELFKKAFPEQAEDEININTINRAIAAYVKSLVALNAPFDQYMRKERDDLNVDAIRGFNLFMGKAGCGTCHFAPIFNGTVPPRFIESETEVLGVPVSADILNPVLDADSGRAEFIKSPVFLHSFKTTTVRNVSLTAPYMHNGVFSTLEEVIDFYEAGGGQGLGLEVPNQTLPSDQLNLSTDEKKDLIAFMISLTDTTAISSIPTRLPAFPKNTLLNKRVVGGNY